MNTPKDGEGNMDSQDQSQAGGGVAAHTPGPWAVGVADCYINGAPVGDWWRGIDADGWGNLAVVVTRMSDGTADIAQGHANARLIAAAPDLLEALVDMVALLPQVDARYADCTIMANAQAAVSKALGQ